MPGTFHTLSLEDIAAWPQPNYDQPVERHWLTPFAIFWTTLSTVLVCSRIVLRVRGRSGTFGSDDVFIIIGWVFSVVFTAIAGVLQYQYSLGRHIWDVEPTKFSGSLYYAWLAQVMYIFATAGTKTSVLLFFHRMVKDSYNRKWLYTVWVLLFITIGSWIGIFFAYTFMCRPLKVFWNIYLMIETDGPDLDYTCINGDALTIAVGVITIASDFYAAAYPCLLFYHYDLGANRRQKMALNVIFCLGFLVTGVGIARTYYLWEIGHNTDLDWIGYNLYAVSIVEVQLAIICTCAPFLRSMLRNYNGSRRATQSRSNASRTRNTDNTATNNNETVRSYSGASRLSINGARASTSAGMPLTPKGVARSSSSPSYKDFEEKSGYLVEEEGSGRLIWKSKGFVSNCGDGERFDSTTGALFPTEPLDPV